MASRCLFLITDGNGGRRLSRCRKILRGGQTPAAFYGGRSRHCWWSIYSSKKAREDGLVKCEWHIVYT